MDNSTQTHTITSSAYHIELSIDYLKTVHGILKIVQIVLSIIAFSCAFGSSWSSMGWVRFVAISGFIDAIFYLVVHLVIVFHSRWTIVIELIIYCIWTLFFLIAGIVAAADGGLGSYGSDGSAGAASAFSFFAMVAWGIDAVLQAKNLRITWTTSSTSGATTGQDWSTSTASNIPSDPPKYEEAVHY